MKTKYFCTQLCKEVEHSKDCVECPYYEDCPDRPTMTKDGCLVLSILWLVALIGIWTAISLVRLFVGTL